MSLRILNVEPPIHHMPCFEAGAGGKRISTVVPVHFATVEGLPTSLDALICTSDLQSREVDGTGCPARLLGEAAAEELEVLLSFEGLSLGNSGVLLAGDFYAAPGVNERGVSGDVTSVWQAFSQRSRWVCGVLGNHDRLVSVPEALLLLDDMPAGHKHAGLTIAGLNYIIGDPLKPGRRAEDEYLKDLGKRLRSNPQILVLHESPAVGDELGSEVITRALQSAKNLLVVSGHVRHREALHELPNGVQVLNVDGRVVVLRGSKTV